MTPGTDDLMGQPFNRRRMLAAGGAGIAAAGIGTTLAAPAGAAPANRAVLTRRILKEFSGLPGQKAMKIYVPGSKTSKPWVVQLNPGKRLVVASSFKCFVLAESLRQAERKINPRSRVPRSQQLDAILGANMRPLNQSIWVPGSSIYNPPALSGHVSERAALEAMISHSDNTGTDVSMKNAGSANIRALIARMGLRKTQIPDSVRRFYAYMLGFPDWQRATWADISGASGRSYPFRQPFNPVQSSISCPDDFVSFYSRAIVGKIFRYPETTERFRQILTMHAETLETMPLGTTPCQKGGALDHLNHHVLALQGSTFTGGRWVSYSTMLNWRDGQGPDWTELEPRFGRSLKKIFTWIGQGM